MTRTQQVKGQLQLPGMEPAPARTVSARMNDWHRLHWCIDCLAGRHGVCHNWKGCLWASCVCWQQAKAAKP